MKKLFRRRRPVVVLAAILTVAFCIAAVMSFGNVFDTAYATVADNCCDGDHTGWTVLPSDLSPFFYVCSTVKSGSQRQKFLPKTLKLPTAT